MDTHFINFHILENPKYDLLQVTPQLMKYLYLFFFLPLVISCNTDSDLLPCSITDLEIATGECTSATTYNLTLNFNYENVHNDTFDVYVRNNELIGTYNLSDLPLTLHDFEMSGLDNDFIKVCINDNQECCQLIEFLPPVCEETSCSITDLEVTTGGCTSATTYNLTLNFNYENVHNDTFDVYVRNNELIGTYNLSDLPLTLHDFEMSGLDNDFIKVCINDSGECCQVIEFAPPACNP